MFDIGWSELVVIGVVALIVIGPKELPGVLRTIGQWMGKVRRMAAEFQGQFNEAMREAEMADLKKSFDDIKDTASSLSKNNILTSLTQDVSDAMKVGDLNEPASTSTSSSTTATSESTTPLIETETHGAALEPLAITREAETARHDATVAATPIAEVKPAEVHSAEQYLDADLRKDAKAS
ncbi:MAG: twin-arginine translocase subunit TatB [Rhizobiales bacterium]|nr:twin-arginine translocase subunit TatB [Hyphomicrobiales bacterium]